MGQDYWMSCFKTISHCTFYALAFMIRTFKVPYELASASFWRLTFYYCLVTYGGNTTTHLFMMGIHSVMCLNSLWYLYLCSLQWCPISAYKTQFSPSFLYLLKYLLTFQDLSAYNFHQTITVIPFMLVLTLSWFIVFFICLWLSGHQS